MCLMTASPNLMALPDTRSKSAVSVLAEIVLDAFDRFMWPLFCIEPAYGGHRSCSTAEFLQSPIVAVIFRGVGYSPAPINGLSISTLSDLSGWLKKSRVTRKCSVSA